MERLAIMGGTYDPIHEGHLRIADAVQRQLEFDRVLFLPALNPPHKQYRHRFASPEDRLAMVRLAVAPYPYFMASSLEYERGGLSYTYDLVRLLQDRRPDADLALIIGEDSLEQLGTWYRAEDLLRLVRFVVAARPGYRPREGIHLLERQFGSWVRDRVVYADVPETAVSSTEIRDRVRRGLPIRGMVPAAVERYIAEKGLYRWPAEAAEDDGAETGAAGQKKRE
ncbi:MAG: nicotinate-nucleotide adenylyltransferase [Succiniclasticum sp.]|jgi:nicotinate-nucleotide adenylyltransferase|nr:nicotinate-nucleotide adenylyltransferase [Succiniclasticum sp.]MEE3479871.1 nicotinate-nucleotide adenylyltransferase [Succiniclasticum sp.]